MSRQSLSDLARGSVLVFSDGYRTRQDQLDPNGIPILRVAEVTGSVLRPADGDRVSASLRSRMGVKTSRPGDVLITTKGTVGRVAMVPSAFPEHVYSPQLCFLRVLDRSQIDPGWLYCWARSPEFLEQVAKYSGQTDMAPYLSLRDLGSIEIDVPSLDEQRRIAGALGALDELIGVNRKLADDLRALVRSFYGAALARGASVAAGDVIDFKYGKALPARDRRPGRFPVVSSAGIVDSHDKSLVSGPGVVVGRKGTVGSVTWVDADFFPIDTAFYVQTDLPMLYAFLALESIGLSGMNTDSAVPGLNRENALRRSITVLPQSDLDRLMNVIQPLWNAAQALEVECSELASTRDELLPLLVSGRVRVGDVAA